MSNNSIYIAVVAVVSVYMFLCWLAVRWEAKHKDEIYPPVYDETLDIFRNAHCREMK